MEAADIDTAATNLSAFNKKNVAKIKCDVAYINKAINQPAQNYQQMPLLELEEVILSLSQYSLFINSELNLAKTRLKYFKSKFEDRLIKVIMGQKIQAKSREEREILARNSDKELEALYVRMKEYELKQTRLEGIPIGINMHASILRDIYHTRCNSSNGKYNRTTE